MRKIVNIFPKEHFEISSHLNVSLEPSLHTFKVLRGKKQDVKEQINIKIVKLIYFDSRNRHIEMRCMQKMPIGFSHNESSVAYEKQLLNNYQLSFEFVKILVSIQLIDLDLMVSFHVVSLFRCTIKNTLELLKPLFPQELVNCFSLLCRCWHLLDLVPW